MNLNQGKTTALARGRLSPETLIKDPDYEPTSCMQLFSTFEGFQNGKWILNQFVQFRNGEGVRTSNGQVPCGGTVTAWTVDPGSRYPYIFICNRFSSMSRRDRAIKVIHEILHTAGMKENTGNWPSPSEIDALISRECF